MYTARRATARRYVRKLPRLPETWEVELFGIEPGGPHDPARGFWKCCIDEQRENVATLAPQIRAFAPDEVFSASAIINTTHAQRGDRLSRPP
jgi:hypothetical protein